MLLQLLVIVVGLWCCGTVVGIVLRFVLLMFVVVVVVVVC